MGDSMNKLVYFQYNEAFQNSINFISKVGEQNSTLDNMDIREFIVNE